MRFLLPFFLFITSILFAQVAVTENDPSALVEGIVNVVTGDLYAVEDDIIIQGAEPLRLKRSYISAKGNGLWSFTENLTAILLPPLQRLQVTEPNGTVLVYRYEQKEIKHKKTKKTFRPLDLTQDAQGLTNTARGHISAQHNLKNQYVVMDSDEQKFSVICPNGTKRTYRANSHQKPVKMPTKVTKIEYYPYYYYHLVSEELPNGNKIIYDWHKNKLTSIRTTDPTGRKTYAQASLYSHGRVKKTKDYKYLTSSDFDIATSDGRVLQYRYFCEGKPEKQGNWYLHQVLSADFPSETIHYYSKNKHRNRILSAITLPYSRDLHIGYYDNPKDARYSCVHALSSPVGPDATPSMTHRFDYHFPERNTIVEDANGIPTHYFWDEHLRLSRIDRYLTSSTLYCSTQFVWGSNVGPDATNLVCKVLLDQDRKPLHATTYHYDLKGNVICEKFYGNLSGQGTALSLDARQLPIENGVESYTKRYAYSEDGKNLLVRKEEENGLLIIYTYLPGTDLPLSEISYDKGTIKRRTFYHYNSDLILTQEVHDDGVTSDPNDLTGVKTRFIRHIHPRQAPPFLGMPDIIEEKYWDGYEEKLLKKTKLHYTTGGRIATREVFDADATLRYSLSYTYDEKGRLLEETNALGQIAQSRYDDLGNKIFFQNCGSRTHLLMSYDYSNRLIETKEIGDDGSTHLTRHAYDRTHNKISTTDIHGNETRYVYDSLNQLIETHLPPLEGNSPLIRSIYDAAGREISHTDAKGYITITHYNAYGHPTTIDHPDGTQERFIYNRDGTLHTHINQNGLETSYTYDVFGRTTSTIKRSREEIVSEEHLIYDAYRLIIKIDAEGTPTTYSYDGVGRKISEKCNDELICYSYDPLGRLQCIRTGDLLTITEHDLLDRVIEERKEDLEGHLLAKTLSTYDSAGDQTTSTQFVAGKETTEHFTYDPFHRLIETRDPLGNATTTHYDDALHTKTLIDPLGLKTHYTFNAHDLIHSIEKQSPNGDRLLLETNVYDPNDNLISKETTLFAQERTVTTHWEYGPLNQLQTLTEAVGTPEQKSTTYTYTPTGKLLETRKPSGITLSNTYDPFDYLISQSASDHTIYYTYIYNRLGHLLQSTNQLDQTTLIRTYDPKGRLLSESFPYGATISNQYDTQGRRVRFDLHDESFILYSYDPLHLRSVTRYNHSGEIAYTHAYTHYDLSHHPITQELIAGLGTLNRNYDLAGRSTTLTAPSFSHEILSYDPVGNILEAQLDDETLSFTYDDLYQLTSESDHIYAYDALYNRLQKDTISYAINALNQIPSDFIYDADGNLIQHKETTYAYDALGRLISVQTPIHQLHFTYDSFHRRLSKTVRGETSEHTLYFLYDDKNEIGSMDPSGTTQELRILGRTPQAEIGAAVALELQGNLYAPIHDLYGNVASLLSLNHPQETFHYTAFGEEKNPHPTLNPWRFSSKRIDEETGLIYFGRRYYLPSYGRWLTPDPLGFDAGPNLYSYVSNAPLTHVDLYGLFQLSDAKQAGIGSIHGVGEFALNTASFGYGMYWASTLPFRRGTFSENWSAFKSSNASFHEMGNRWMHRMLPGDHQSSIYQQFRGGVSSGLDLGLAMASGVGIAKGVYTVATQGPALVRGAMNLQRIGRATTSSTQFNLPKFSGRKGLTSNTANVIQPYTKSNLQLGRQMHNTYKQGVPGLKEYRLPSGRRIDFLDIPNGIMYELKPYNPRAIKLGKKQLELYLEEIKTVPRFKNIDWKTVLETY